MAARVTPQQLQATLGSPDATHQAFLDVREAGEYNEAHIAGVTLLTRSQIEARLRMVVPDRAARITLVDDTGARALLAAFAVPEPIATVVWVLIVLIAVFALLGQFGLIGTGPIIRLH